jgi:hypothetical protein
MCDTTTKAVSADAESEWPLFGVKPVPCHELENVIPHDVVTLLQCAVGNEWNRKIKRISDWENRGRKPLEEAFWLFFDVKEGLAATGLGAFSPAEMEWIQKHRGSFPTVGDIADMDKRWLNCFYKVVRPWPLYGG